MPAPKKNYRQLPKVKVLARIPEPLFQRVHRAIGANGRSYSEEVAAALASFYDLDPARFGIQPDDARAVAG